MPTSVHSGLLLSGYGLDATKAVGASIARDYAVNNLLHLADEYAQVRVAWIAPTEGEGYVTGRTASITADRWYPIASFGAFPIALRQDGSSYRLRVRLGGSSSGGHAVKFRLVFAPQRDALDLVNTTAGDFIFETATTTSGTGAWLTGTSQGVEAWTTQVQIPPEYAATWMRETSTLSDIGGSAVGVQQCLVACSIFGSTANAASVPRLSGVYAAEFVGG